MISLRQLFPLYAYYLKQYGAQKNCLEHKSSPVIPCKKQNKNKNKTESFLMTFPSTDNKI